MSPTSLMDRYKAACDFKQPVDAKGVEAAVSDYYKTLGFEPKPLTMFGSLEDARDAWAAWDATWVSAICIGAEAEKKENVLSDWMPIFRAMESGLWLYWFQDDAFCWIPRPAVKTENNSLHCSSGPSFELPNQKLYFLNGVYVPESLVMTPAEKIDPALVLKEPNAEVRREIVRKVGMERLVDKLGAEVIDKRDGYELLLLDLKDGRKREYLKMRNPSISTWHIEGVPPGTRTVDAALTWRNGTPTSPAELT